ncbi:hypothetical protein ACEQ8H_002680 [Pleosporales sp. CAS-2024a]
MKRVNALLNRSAPDKPEPHPITTSTRTFIHKPLDETKSSLRLVTVNSELSADGCIQCYVSHSSLDRASYVCLSYRWGSSQKLNKIHINGAPFYVRDNLFDFLQLVRNMPVTYYWIDAICIDQGNSSERNHQVAQMGRIFSGAFLVYLWLGSLPVMAHWIQYLRALKGRTPGSHDDESYAFLKPGDMVEAHTTVGKYVFNNEYWSRAWVTQEILLARNVVVLVCGESFKISDLVTARVNFDNVDLGNFTNCAMNRFAQVVDGSSKFQHEPLIQLLDSFRDTRCEIPRDHIYSLLALSSDAHLPGVDYKQASEDLAHEVLSLSDEPLCVCSALLLAQVLHLADKAYDDDCRNPDSRTILEFRMRGLRFARHVMLANDVVQSWAHYKLLGTDIFGHDYVFTHFCPAFDVLMDALQAQAIQLSRMHPAVNSEADPLRSRSSFLFKTMDYEHKETLLYGFGDALTVTAHQDQRDICTMAVTLELLAEMVPDPVRLCPRVAPRKDKGRGRASLDLSSMPEGKESLHLRLPAGRGSIDSRIQSTDLRRIDSLHPSKIDEEEGPVSGLRVRRSRVRPG